MAAPLLPLHAALRPYLAEYRFIQVPASMGALSWVEYPRIAVDMVFIFSGKVQLQIGDQAPFWLSQAAFTGHFEEFYRITIPAGADCLHLRFHPGQAHLFCSHPQYLCTNTSQSLSDFVQPDAWELYQEMGELEEPSAQIHCLEQRLRQWQQPEKKHPALDEAIRRIIRSHGKLSVDELCQYLGTNYKSLNRWFKAKVGVSPKRFMQMTRFKEVLECMENQLNPQTDWMQLVADFGFHDQAHFIRDFKQFAGMAPSAFLANRQANPVYG